MSRYIPFDIIAIILSNLDIKTLLCCRCVSKEWCSLIDSNGFINTQMSQSIKTNTNKTLFILEQGSIYHLTFCGLYSVKFDAFDPGNEINLKDQPCTSTNWLDVHLMGSCNGLVCLSNDLGDVIVLNQSTREYKVIQSFVRYIFKGVVRLAPYEDIWGSGYGFGYDQVSKDYKVVRIAKFGGIDFTNLRESEMTIYSVKKDFCWVMKMPYVILFMDDKKGVYVHGSLHWIAIRSDNWMDTRRIVGFDLGVHEFREVPQPDYGGNVIDIDIGVLGGCLCVFAKFRNVGADVWVMKEYGVKESWSKVFSISSNVLSSMLVRPLGYSRRGREVLLELDESRLVWYGIETKRFENVVIKGRMKERFESILCLNSLVPPHDNDIIVVRQLPPEGQEKAEEEEG